MTLQVGKIEDSKYLNMLIYGKSSTGKTVLAGSAAEIDELNSVLFINVEGGVKSIKKVWGKETSDKIDVVNVNSYKEFVEITEFLKKHIQAKQQSNKEAIKKIAEHYTPGLKPKIYNTIIIDSITEVQSYLMEHILDSQNDLLPEKFKKAQYNEWGKNRTGLRKIITTLRDLEIHTIFIALEKVDRNEKTNIETVVPNVGGSFREVITAYFDFVGYLKAEASLEDGFKNRLLLAPINNIQAKDRITDLGVKVDNPKMDILLKSYFNKEEK